jgi:Tol biopolymer transport system component
MNRRLTILLVLMVLAPVAGIIYLLGSPRLESVSPEINAAGVPASAELRLKFSRRMQPDTVTQRLEITPHVVGNFAWDASTLIFTPNQLWPSGTKINIQLKPGALAAGLLSFPINRDSSWSFTIGQPRLAYLHPADAAANIYVLNPSTSQVQQVTEVPGGILEFDVNTDGTTIFFSAHNAQDGSDLYRLDGVDKFSQEDVNQPTPQPGEPVLVLNCKEAQCRSPKVSPQDDFLAYEVTGVLGSDQPTYSQVWYLPLSADGQAAQDSAPVPKLAGEIDHQSVMPTWSPEGLLTYYDTNLAAFVFLDPKSGQSVLFPNGTGQPGTWDSNGKEFVAPEISLLSSGDPNQTGLEQLSNSHLIRFDFEKRTSEDLSKDENLEDTAPVFSPDGQFLAFARRFLNVEDWTPGRQLWLMGADGSQPHPLTNDPYFNHFEFAWNPNGKQIAFVRFNQTDLTEPPEIWIIDPETTRAQRLVVGGYAPQWIP